MSAKTNDTLYLAAGGLALLGTCVWAFFQQSAISAFRAPINPPASGAAYEPTPLTLTPAEPRQWTGPGPQSAGPEWIFDVFTPPVIYYDTNTKVFDVRPPKVGPVDPVTPPPADPFGVELVKVEQPLFRLQLVGYIGEGATARGTFENQVTGQVIFGTTGKKIPDLNLEIVSFSAERRRIPVEGGTELVVTEATAVVRDTNTGVETTLDAKVRTPEGPLTVTLKKPDGTELVAKSGDVLTLGQHTYTIGDLRLAPPSAVVTKAGGKLTAPKTETLVIPPPPPPAVPKGEGDSFVPPPDTPPGTRPAPGGFPGF
jgi:hypothetical protein